MDEMVADIQKHLLQGDTICLRFLSTIRTEFTLEPIRAIFASGHKTYTKLSINWRAELPEMYVTSALSAYI